MRFTKFLIPMIAMIVVLVASFAFATGPPSEGQPVGIIQSSALDFVANVDESCTPATALELGYVVGADHLSSRIVGTAIMGHESTLAARYAAIAENVPVSPVIIAHRSGHETDFKIAGNDYSEHVLAFKTVESEDPDRVFMSTSIDQTAFKKIGATAQKSPEAELANEKDVIDDNGICIIDTDNSQQSGVLALKSLIGLSAFKSQEAPALIATDTILSGVLALKNGASPVLIASDVICLDCIHPVSSTVLAFKSLVAVLSVAPMEGVPLDFVPGATEKTSKAVPTVAKRDSTTKAAWFV